MNKNRNSGEKTSLYGAIDNTIMRGVNCGVKIWNWTTGGTKAELANLMLTISPILQSVGMLNEGITLGIIGTASGILVSHVLQKRNIQIEKIEAKALNSNAMNIEVESYKFSAKCLGPILASGPLPWTFFHGSKNGLFIPDKTQTDYCTALGCALTSGSFYIIRADYIPPRKNALARGLENVREWLRTMETQPAYAY